MRTAAVTTDSWATSLETWTRSYFRGAAGDVAGTMDFAPRITRRPYTFYDLPVVMVVMTRHTAHLQTAILHSLELLREATYGFRAVVVTDSATGAGFHDVDWTVEHILGEREWLAAREGNWLPHAADHVLWAQNIYGASIVLAPETPGQVQQAIVRLAERFQAADKVLATARGLAEEQSSAPENSVRAGLRGWWQDISDSADIAVLADEASALRLRISRGALPGVLLGQAGAEVTTFRGQAEAAEYSTAVLSWEARSTGGVAEPDAGAEGREARQAQRLQRWLHAAVMACAEELAQGGPSLWLEGGAAAGGPDLAADVAAEVAADRATELGEPPTVTPQPLDGTIDLRSSAVPGQAQADASSPVECRVHMSYSRSLDVQGEPSVVPVMLNRLRQIHLMAQA
jgi:hypothetical protein